jgi:predicted CoA-substrate-specific enzyme activase
VIVAGIDIGSRTAKALILKDDSVLSYSLISTSADSAKIGREALETALKTAGISINSIEQIIATGYGRFIAPFADETVSEISCHSKGANYLFPSVRTVLDMGGQDCKAIKCDEKGNVKNFVMNDKCAAGTGRFLEVIAEAMEIPLGDGNSLRGDWKAIFISKGNYPYQRDLHCFCEI